MRRTLATTLVALSTTAALSGAAPSPAGADEADGAAGSGLAPVTGLTGGLTGGLTDGLVGVGEVLGAAPRTSTGAASRVLDDTVALLGSSDPSRSRGVTIALRDLALAMPGLDAADRETAGAILARPTSPASTGSTTGGAQRPTGGGTPIGGGYTTGDVKRKCNSNFCVHYVRTTDDAATHSWAKKNLAELGRVWKKEVRKLGYKKPLSDKDWPGSGGSDNGGNGKFDVYLQNLGDDGVYGYCTTEFVRVKNGRSTRQGGGYCVLDNDFSTAEYGAPPADSMKVTAAHEFFHAIQFAYDYTEDGWLLESTATWMEERHADKVDDNRQYLPASQISAPQTPLDLFNSGGSQQYGNWVWWEHLTQQFGNGLVKKVWNTTTGGTYSTQAVKKVLKKKGGFPKRYARFAAGNLNPARSYPEGKNYAAAPATTWTLTKAAPKQTAQPVIDHMASRSFEAKPDAELTASGWKATIRVDGPNRSTSPQAVVVVKNKKGGWDTRAITLNKKGNGKIKVPFSSKKVRGVTVSLVNASTRFNCGDSGYIFSCQGAPKDDEKPFKVFVTAAR